MDTQEIISKTEALHHAHFIEFHLQDKCTKFSVCGAIRRKDDLISEIDIVCSPDYAVKRDFSLFDSKMDVTTNPVKEWVHREMHSDSIELMAASDKLFCFKFHGVPVTIYMVDEQNYGLAQAIHTASNSYFKRMEKSWISLGYELKGLALVHKKSGLPPHPFPTEKAFFNWLNWTYKKPELREN